MHNIWVGGDVDSSTRTFAAVIAAISILRMFAQFASRSKHDLVGSLRGALKKLTVGGLLRRAKDDGGGG